jgi:flagellar hook-associated protein 3 FlgL
MRTTFNSQFRDGAAGIEAATQRIIEAQRQVSTGKKLNKISDDPAGAANAIAERNALGAVEQYERTSQNVGSRLTVVDTVLDDIIAKLSKVQQVALVGRGTPKTQVERDAAGAELRGLKSALLDNLNATFQGTFLFSGANSTTPPYTEGGGGVVAAYAGSATELGVDIGDGRSVTIAFDGNTIAQGADAQHIFDSMDDLITAVVAGDEPNITAGVQAIERAFQRATSAQSVLGNDMHEIDTQKLRLQQMKLSGTERLSKLEEANMAEAITNMTNAEAAYQAALGAVSTATRASLLDYLK